MDLKLDAEIPEPTERDWTRDAVTEYELIIAACPGKGEADKATSELILSWIRLATAARHVS